jgi:glycerol-3-phosphate dehydrogenase
LLFFISISHSIFSFKEDEKYMQDVIIIGAGVSGCAIARELSRYQLKIMVLEKNSDVCEGTSKANSGIVHAGYDAKVGSLKAKLNIIGNQLMEALSKDLDFPFQRNGSLVLCFHEEEREQLEQLYENGLKNGVTGLKILNKVALKRMEPHISDKVTAALYAPTGGIVCPFNLTIALAENAFTNGVQFSLNTEVYKVERIEYEEDCCYHLNTNNGGLYAKVVINAAGVYADQFHNMVSKNKMKITARKGEYCLLDKAVGNYVNKTLFQLPGKLGKGVLVAPTVHGNLLIGPTAADIWDKEQINTIALSFTEIITKASHSVEHLPVNKIITSFAGLRAHEEQDDFIIEEVKDAPGFIDIAGIESPGLTSAPAIGQFAAEIVLHIMPAVLKSNFISTRKGIPNIASLSHEEREKLIKCNPAYANVICRCETVTEGEIIDAIHRPLGATTLDGIKRRTRAGSGRCQAGFCLPKTMGILARELGTDIIDITKFGGNSRLILSTKESDQTK